MGKFVLKYKAIIFLMLISSLGLFFYSFRLKETQLFRDDTARDTLKILRIWQNKDLTLIGPPVSFTQETTREVYLGSLFLYIGLVGLILANWDAVGAVLPNIFFFTLSIPFFYLMISKITKSFWMTAFATTLYTLSPVTVTHARFFWNPNLIIPASVFFWHFVLKDNYNKSSIVINSVFAGIIAGLMFNFHYLVIVPLIVYTITLSVKRMCLKTFSILIGLIIGSIPIILFEFKNNFYLTNGLLHNLFEKPGPIHVNFTDGIYYLFNIFWSIFGLRSSEIDFPATIVTTAPNSFLLIITLLIIIAAIMRGKLIYKQPSKESVFWPMILVGILITIYFSFGNPLRMRYLFAVYPILLLSIIKFLWGLRMPTVMGLFFIPIIITSTSIILDQPKLMKNFISLPLIENICKEIVKDDTEGRYNITENLKGDARAMSFRYCVTKDAKVKPQDEYSYNNLTSLYVISPSLDKIYKENRWEFYASAPWRLMETSDFGEVKLFKFVHDYD